MRSALLLSVLSAAIAPAASLAAGPSLKEGTAFPDLRLPALHGGRLSSVSAFRGRKLLVLVFASW